MSAPPCVVVETQRPPLCYRDFSREPNIRTAAAIGGDGVAKTMGTTTKTGHFPTQLHGMLSQAESAQYNHICSWRPHGRAFQVHDKDSFESSVMSGFFRTTRFASFQRQLNLYGFIRITDKGSKDYGAYYHEYFLRGRPDLCERIAKIGALGAEDKTLRPEPDFYAMEPVNKVPPQLIAPSTVVEPIPEQGPSDAATHAKTPLNRNHSADLDSVFSKMFTSGSRAPSMQSFGESQLQLSSMILGDDSLAQLSTSLAQLSSSLVFGNQSETSADVRMMSLSNATVDPGGMSFLQQLANQAPVSLPQRDDNLIQRLPNPAWDSELSAEVQNETAKPAGCKKADRKDPPKSAGCSAEAEVEAGTKLDDAHAVVASKCLTATASRTDTDMTDSLAKGNEMEKFNESDRSLDALLSPRVTRRKDRQLKFATKKPAPAPIDVSPPKQLTASLSVQAERWLNMPGVDKSVLEPRKIRPKPDEHDLPKIEDMSFGEINKMGEFLDDVNMDPSDDEREDDPRW